MYTKEKNDRKKDTYVRYDPLILQNCKNIAKRDAPMMTQKPHTTHQHHQGSTQHKQKKQHKQTQPIQESIMSLHVTQKRQNISKTFFFRLRT